ncbi:SET domain-containing protein-lysine N-methyltransferase [Candidatus Woesebacteria bacterium]|nr:SET domain-containing protein-lysine N-methyltransferase [Candidatus Woesebacteria bacterium]
MVIFPPKKIKIIKINNKGRGVVATEKILKGEVIEKCPLIILGKEDDKFIKDKSMSDTLYYYYLQQPDLKRDCIMLGYGSLYNHSSSPNSEIDYENDQKETNMIFRAIRDIEAGEEITWDYKFDNDLIEYLSDIKKYY